MSMQIRTLTETDQPCYTQLWCDALVDHDACFRIAYEDEPLPRIQTQFSDESFTMGVFDSAKLVATVSVERDMRTKLNHKALLFRMFVHSSMAGKGVGRVLINEAIAKAKSMVGLRQLYLTVLANNHKAIHLYSSLGFERFALEPEAVKINDHYVDELQMAYFLSR